MAVRNFLIEGVSGAGKTSVAEELERRGYPVIHGDRELAYLGDPDTGKTLTLPLPNDSTAGAAWINAHWIWPVEKVKALIAERSDAVCFFCGASRNSRHFIDLFEMVFVLDIALDTLEQRLDRRPADEFGGRPAERALILGLHASQADIPRGGIIIDASVPVPAVADAILVQCNLGPRRGDTR